MTEVLCGFVRYDIGVTQVEVDRVRLDRALLRFVGDCLLFESSDKKVNWIIRAV